jgi:hypothetical protein
MAAPFNRHGQWSFSRQGWCGQVFGVFVASRVGLKDTITEVMAAS